MFRCVLDNQSFISRHPQFLAHHGAERWRNSELMTSLIVCLSHWRVHKMIRSSFKTSSFKIFLIVLIVVVQTTIVLCPNDSFTVKHQTQGKVFFLDSFSSRYKEKSYYTSSRKLKTNVISILQNNNSITKQNFSFPQISTWKNYWRIIVRDLFARAQDENILW